MQTTRLLTDCSRHAAEILLLSDYFTMFESGIAVHVFSMHGDFSSANLHLKGVFICRVE